MLSKGILIFVSFFLGYMQGKKWKKRKIKKDIKELEEENKNLQKELKEERRKQRLEMFNGHAKVKGDKIKFEQDLTIKFTENNNNREIIIEMYAVLLFLKLDKTILLSDTLITDTMEYEIFKSTNESIQIGINKENRNYTLDAITHSVDDFRKIILSFDQYHLSYETTKKSMEYIIKNF